MDPSLSLAPEPISAAFAPPFTLLAPRLQSAPVVFASPHSGREYPQTFLDTTRLDPVGLRRSEDSFVDELFATAPEHGAPLLAATFPRAFCDPNREPWELDPAMFHDPLPSWVNTSSARVGAGLGTIARVVASGEAIYRGKLTFADAEERVRRYWQPYHKVLAQLLAQTRAQFGACLLIDCHSMPTHRYAGGRMQGPDIVLGDAHGTACAPEIVRLAESVLTGLGFAVRRNDPYAGGYVTRHYGRPHEGVHALQIEISRALYMDEDRIEKRPEFQGLQEDLGLLIAALMRLTPELLLR